jgi:hypothetical protein
MGRVEHDTEARLFVNSSLAYSDFFIRFRAVLWYDAVRPSWGYNASKKAVVCHLRMRLLEVGCKPHQEVMGTGMGVFGVFARFLEVMARILAD